MHPKSRPNTDIGASSLDVEASSSTSESRTEDNEDKLVPIRIDSMNMRDGESGDLLWQADYSDHSKFWKDEITATLPKSILTKSSISREISFHSSKQLNRLRLVQHVILNGMLIEEWKFEFDFVIEGSTNSWQQTIKSAPNVMDAETLSGNIVIETSFYDGQELIAENKMRIYYK
jgi:retinal rod rhodopsin-sensitive cGMP 3',5'-cyclic phosphodiesterase subunit delta